MDNNNQNNNNQGYNNNQNNQGYNNNQNNQGYNNNQNNQGYNNNQNNQGYNNNQNNQGYNNNQNYNNYNNNQNNQNNNWNSKPIANKFIIALSYLGVLFIVPWLCYPEDKTAKFHANQGLILLLFGMCANVIASMSLFLFAPLGAFAFLAVWVACITFCVLGIISVFKGEEKRLPLIGKWDILK